MILRDYTCKKCETEVELWVEQDDQPTCEECGSDLERRWGFSIIAKGLTDSAPSRIGKHKRSPYKIKNETRADWGGL